ncbi:MAG TPA: amidase family protein [Rhizomicrobium sp.]|nr:amidase family protein [Rhizomicrobium sp.]
MTDTYATARQMVADLKAKKVSARELLNAHLARNDQVHKAINAVVDTDIARAQKDAQAIDDARVKGEVPGALAGLPLTIKDGFDVENMPALAGNPMLKDRPKDCADADVVAATRKAGAVIWGKTNVPFMLGDLQTYNAIYGTTNNPYDVTKGPGGSSGGSAAALATGVTPLEIGSDIGGSLRHPANFCGVTALKTTQHSLSGRGHVPPGPDTYAEGDLGVFGPMARNVDDLKLMWSVLKGTPEKKRADIKGAHVALWNEEASWPLMRDVKAATERAGKALAAAGAHVEHAKPDIDGAKMMDFYLNILVPTISAGMPEEVLAAMEANRAADKKAAAAGDEGAKQRLRATATFREVAAAHVEQQRHKDKLAAFFAKYDAILMPISMSTPFAHQQEPAFADRVLTIDNVQVPYPKILEWISLATSCHAPALAVQAGQTDDGLPIGVQVVGPWNGEDRLFDFAFAIEDGLGGFKRPNL